MLGATDCCTVLEIGPALGLVTSLLVNIGYDVTTLDRGPRSFAYPNVPHLEKDICELRSDEIAGYDAILCCETLEHIEWERVGSVLATFRESGAKYLIVSVPYMGFQVFVELYANSSTLRQYFSMKKLLWRKNFQARTARRTPVGNRIQGLPSEALGEAAQRQRVVDRKAGLHRTLPLRVPPAESPVSSRAQ